MADFVAVDVETANANMASICQIGLVRFSNGQEADAASWLIDPKDYFDDENIAIHGITPEQVKGQPSFSAVAEQLTSWLSSPIVVCHTHFDRVSLDQVFRRHRSEEHTSELQSLMRTSYAVFCLKKKNSHNNTSNT